MFFVRVVLGPSLYVPTKYVIKYVKKRHKRLRNQKMAREEGEGGGVSGCMRSISCWRSVCGKLLVLLHWAKVGLDSRHYENWNTFLSLVLEGKQINHSYSFIHFWLFENRLLSAGLSPVIKSNCTFRNCMKNEFYRSNPSFFCDIMFRGKWDLKIDKILSKTTSYRCSAYTKRIQWLGGKSCWKMIKNWKKLKMSLPIQQLFSVSRMFS